MKRPAFQFYPSDWWKDPGLRISSLEARGLWIDMMAIMHDGEPYGHLTVRMPGAEKATPLDVAQLARLVGASPAKVAKLLAELKRNGVSSQTAEGVYYSRRMVRDEAARNARAENGKLGGNPALTGRGKDNHPDNQPPNPRDKSKPTPSSSASSSAASASSSAPAKPVRRMSRRRALDTPLPPGVEALLDKYYATASEERREDVRDQCRGLLLHEEQAVRLNRDGVERMVPVNCHSAAHLEAACRAVMQRTIIKPDAAIVLVLGELAVTYAEWRNRLDGDEPEPPAMGGAQ